MPEKKTIANLRDVADRVGLAPCSVSAVLNKTAAASGIPQQTKDRIFRAAAELNYQPNYFARSLRTRRTHMVAVVSYDFGRSSVCQVVAGMERLLRRRGYLLAVAALASPSEWTSFSQQLQQRNVEGIVAVDLRIPAELRMPAVSLHLGSLGSQGPLSPDAGAWLAELGASVGNKLLEKIETKSAPLRTRIVPQLPEVYFGLPEPEFAGVSRRLPAMVGAEANL